MRERVKLDEAAGLRGESIEPRGLGGGARRGLNSAQSTPNVAGYERNGAAATQHERRKRAFCDATGGENKAAAGQRELCRSADGSRRRRS